MRRLWIVLAVGAVLIALAWGGLRRSASPPTDPLVVDGNTEFALALYGRLSRQPGNLFFSPFSLSSCLAMTYAGARGDTEAEIAAVLHFPSQQRLHPAMRGLLDGMGPGWWRPGYVLSRGDALWGQAGMKWRQSFLDTTRRNYGAGLQEVDFDRPEQASRTINAWVKRQTAGKITDLVSAEDATGSVLVLTDAVYFRGRWEDEFDPKDTRDRGFRLLDGTVVTARMMEREGRVPYLAADGLQAVELTYVGERLSMVVLLPDDGSRRQPTEQWVEGNAETAPKRLAELEGKLDAQHLAGWLGGLQPAEVKVMLPRWSMRWRADLAPVLRGMGMKTAFAAGQADFSGMDGSRELFMGWVLHQAWVSVSEAGTEAAAASSDQMALSIEPYPVFQADHPFLFLIRDRQTGSILFMGRVMDPTKG